MDSPTAFNQESFKRRTFLMMIIYKFLCRGSPLLESFILYAPPSVSSWHCSCSVDNSPKIIPLHSLESLPPYSPPVLLILRHIILIYCQRQDESLLFIISLHCWIGGPWAWFAHTYTYSHTHTPQIIKNSSGRKWFSFASRESGRCPSVGRKEIESVRGLKLFKH